MVKYVWTYVFQEVYDENGRTKVIKPSRSSHDFKVTGGNAFDDALEWCLGVTSLELEQMITDHYVVELRL